MNFNNWALGAVGAVSLGLAGFVGLQVARPDPAPPATVAATTDADPALWVVRDDDTTIYLFGTVHLLRPGLSWFDDAVRTAFDKSDQVVLEMILPDEATIQASVMKRGIITSGPTLTERLPAESRDQFIRSLTNVGVPATGFDQLQPWFAANQITALTIQKSGYVADVAPEKMLTDAARKTGKELIELETFDQQLGFFANLAPQTQINYLTMTLAQLDEGTEKLDELVDAWATGDPDRLGVLMNEGLRELPEVGTALLTERNARWAEWIEARMAKPGTVFVAVGAGHLAGNDSLQVMLAKRNLTATRVDY